MVPWGKLVIFITVSSGWNDLVKSVTSTEVQRTQYVKSPHEEDDWWHGAEEVDMSLVFPADAFNEERPGESEYLDNPETNPGTAFTLREPGFDDLTCEDFYDFPPPPDFLKALPPPPVPPNIMELEAMLDELQKTSFKDRSEADTSHLVFSARGGKCHLCEWANSGNDTSKFWPYGEDSKSEKVRRLVGGITGVALLSAVLGALLTAIVLRFKKLNGKTNGPGNRWWFPFKGRKFHCSSSNQSGIDSRCGNQRVPPDRNRSDHSGAPNQEPSTMRLLFSNFWRRSSSQTPLQPRLSVASENSYTEEIYIDNDGVYSELNSPRCCNVSSMNTYSEIQDPIRPSELNICFRLCGHERTYENSGYVLSETPSDPNECSVGSSSTPSSAYYSDVSYCEIKTSKKKKKKKKTGATVQPKITQPTSFSNSFPSSSNIISKNNFIPLSPISSGNPSHFNQTQHVHTSCSSPLPIHVIPNETNHHTMCRSVERALTSNFPKYPVYTLQTPNHAYNFNRDGTFQGELQKFPPFNTSHINCPSSRQTRSKDILHLNGIMQRPLPPVPVNLQTGLVNELDDHFHPEYPLQLPSEYI